ncbi:bifunctional transcriptional activator/DNA repair enzyme AdaA [Companilactobacillus jidongensis]|uniref:bifunctional transcriptional activator/DNA repair enzyme AdaA n=1 Tax=Companilactobacillus jidongensis TaxID=2486006 RepID=UPI000F7A7B51|nr:Ada metal-binding domain-containing protein [Companilactobacillus jidongensis]
MKKYPLTEHRWQQIINNDTQSNFYYGVTTTKIFCKPSCHSRNPLRDNVLIFKEVGEAIDAGFRPCKRCQPTGEVTNYDWVSEIKTYLDNNYQRKLDLTTISEECHGSPFNLQRTFKNESGLTPRQYLTEIRLNKSKNLLQTTDLSIKSIALRVGFSSDTYFITVFKRHFMQTPDSFRLQKL